MPITAYRLVHSTYDPVAVGTVLQRPSNNSNQKLGEGMYFMRTVADATAFAATRGGQRHQYDHLLEVELPFTLAQFYDVNADPNALPKWWNAQLAANVGTMAVSNQTTRAQRTSLFCAAHGFVGVLWAQEILVLTTEIGGGFKITSSTRI